MKVKNLTSFPFGAKVTSRRERRPEATLILRACYVLDPWEELLPPKGPPLLAQGAMRADTYRDDDDERAGECLYPGDFADWKPRTDVMLRGTCHVPDGNAMETCPVRFSVGKWSKTLRIVGRRMWTGDARDALMSRPVSFTKMPVDYAHAYGGAGYAANPVGKGTSGRELPNVEHPGEVVHKRRDDPGPAGFGPINPAWPQRALKMGKSYGPRWRKERYPYYAQDFDWTYFNAAPADQQIEGYLRGDEKLVFQNLHPEEPVFERTLPAVRIRAFLKDSEQRFREVRMNLDTLFADLDEGRLYLTWRGLDPILTDDMKDVLWALVASEPLAEEPQAEAHYRERLEAFAADPLEIKSRVPADLLAKFDEMQARQKARDEGRPVSQHDAPAPDPLTASVRALFDQLPVAPANAKEVEQKVAEAVAAAIAKAPPQVDVKGQIAKAANDATAALARPRVTALPLRTDGPPPSWATKGLQKSLERIEQAKKAASDPKLPADVRARMEQKVAKLDEQMDAFRREPFVQRMMDRPAYQEPGPGKDLRGQDYEGRDLRGKDLSGANLEDANLAGASLAGSVLAGAKLEGAILTEADLEGADLTGANLTLANLTSVRARKAIFRNARFDRAFFQKAHLGEAIWQGAKGDFVFFPEADLSGADCRGVSLFRSLGKGANLTGADFSEASLVRCLLLGVSAHKVKLHGATLTRTSFAKGDLTGADLTNAKGERSIWHGTNLRDADFGHANLPRAQLMETSAVHAGFRRAVLRDSRCYRSSFEQADFSECQLFGIEFSKCVLGRARFTGACLYGAKFRQAVGGGCDFSGANLTRALLQDE